MAIAPDMMSSIEPLHRDNSDILDEINNKYTELSTKAVVDLIKKEKAELLELCKDMSFSTLLAYYTKKENSSHMPICLVLRLYDKQSGAGPAPEVDVVFVKYISLYILVFFFVRLLSFYVTCFHLFSQVFYLFLIDSRTTSSCSDISGTTCH